MPLFKIVDSKWEKKKFVEGSTLAEVLTNSKAKLALDEGVDCKIICAEDGSLLETDEELSALSRLYNEQGKVLQLMALSEGAVWMSEEEYRLAGTNAKGDAILSPRLSGSLGALTISGPSTPETPTTSRSGLTLEFPWTKVPGRMVDMCNSKQEPHRQDVNSMVTSLSDHMIAMKQLSLTVAGSFARALVEKWPHAFSIRDSTGEVLSSGLQELKYKIYDRVNYCKDSTIKRRNKESNGEEESPPPAKRGKYDTYGCVDYEPALPIGETWEEQEEKKEKLKNEENLNTSEIGTLMKQTYATQRRDINSRPLGSGSLEKVLSDWPHLADPACLFDHAERLLDKNIAEVWHKNISEKVPNTLQFIKTRLMAKKDLDKNGQKMVELFNETKESEQRIKSLSLFELLPLYFNESPMFRLQTDDETADNGGALLEELENMVYPILVVKGMSLYDDDTDNAVVCEGTILAKPRNTLEGFLALITSYYVYNFNYPDEIKSSLEWLQREFLVINPAIGNKRGSTPRRRTASAVDAKVKRMQGELRKFLKVWK